MATITVYVTMIHDRHKDPVPHLFPAPEDAIAYARRWSAGWPGDGFVEEPMDGALYHARYAHEADSVWVIPAPLNLPDAPDQASTQEG